MGHEPCRPRREQAPTDVAGSCTMAAASCSTVGCGPAASADAGTGSCARAFAAAVISPAGSNCGRVSCCTGGACTSGCGSPCSRHTRSQHQHVRQNDQRTPLPACCNPTSAGKPLEDAATFTPAQFGPVGMHSRIRGVNERTSSPRVLSVSGLASGSASRPAGSSADGAGLGARGGGGGTCHASAHECVPDEAGAR